MTGDVRDALGLVHVYTGTGKGKTSAALGLALRALGYGLRVHLIQFLKGGGYTGELVATKRFEHLVIEQYGKGISDKPCSLDFEPDAHERERALKALRRVQEVMKQGVDVLILDEVNVALGLGHLGVQEVMNVIKNKPKNTELVLTGRGAPVELLEVADYVTEMKAHKHPYEKGVLGRKGIEY